MIDLKGLIIGCGSIGERHLHNLKKIGVQNIGVYDTSKAIVDKISEKYNTKKFYNVDTALLFKPDFTIICTYPNSHVQLANVCIDADSHLFLEKPISSDLKGVKSMLEKAKSRKINVAIGYNLRFDRGLNLLRKKIQNNEIGTPMSILSQWGHNIKLWRPGLNYKNHYILQQGGGIILDDSHEYDYVRWLLDDEPISIYCQTKKANNIKTATESLATIILKFRKGTIASFILDYIRPKYERECNVIGEKGNLEWEYIPKNNFRKNYNTTALSKITTNFPNRKSKIENITIKVNDMYVNEMKDFVQSILQNKKPKVDGWEGLKTLRIGIAALESATTGKVVRF